MVHETEQGEGTVNGTTTKHKQNLSYSFDYANGTMMPSVVYKF
jgi:hypothetical protein